MIDSFSNRLRVIILSATIINLSMNGGLYYSYLLNIHNRDSSPSFRHLMENI